MTDLLKLGKKVFTVSVVAMTILWSVGVAALLPSVVVAETCPTLQAGDLFKIAGVSSVYLVNKDMKRMYFFNGEIFKTWFKDYSAVQTIPATCTDAYPNGGAVSYRPGSLLVKTAISPTVYSVLPTGQLMKIKDANSAAALYGANWAKLVRDLNDSYFGTYTVGSGEVSDTPTNGMLVKKEGTTDVYSVSAGKLSKVDGALSTNLAGDVRTVSATVFGKLEVATGTATAASLVADPSQGVSSGATGTTPVTTTGNVNVALAADTPAGTTIVAGQAVADLAHFTFTGSGTITSLKLKRVGVSADATLNAVYLYDGNTKVGDAATASYGVLTFANSSGLFTVNGSKTISVKSDITANTGGQTLGIAINAAADIAGVTVGGSFPVTGNTMTIATVTDLATVAANATTNGPGTTINAGTVGATLWSNQFTVSTRAVSLKYVAFKQIGSIPTDGLQNLKLYVNGVQVATGSLGSDNILAFDLSASPFSLATGLRTLEVRGDVIKGSTRTFNLSLQTKSDIVLTDSNYSVNVAISGTIPASPAATTVNGGTVSVQQDSTFTTTQVVSNASNVTFGKWTMKAYGEDVKVMSLALVPTLTGAVNTEGINNLAIYVNGAQVGSSQSYIMASGAFPTLSAFGSGNLFTIPAGTSVTVEARGDLVLTSGTVVAAITMTLRVPASQFQGVSSYNLTPAAITNYGPISLSVVTGALTKSTNAAYVNQTLAPNTLKQKIGSYVIKASNAEAVRVTNLAIGLGGTLGYATNTANLYVSDNTTPVNPQATNNFPVDFTLQPNQTKTIDVFADIGSVDTTYLGQTIITTLAVTAQGISGTSASFSAYTGQTITVNVGTLTYGSTAKTNSSAVAQYVLGGTTQQLVVYNFVAATAPVVIDELGFTFGGTSVDNSDEPIVSITIGGVTIPVVSHGATSTNLNITVPAGNAGKDVPVIVNYNTVGGGAGITYNKTVSTTVYYVKYHAGSTTYTTTTAFAVQSNAMTLVTTKPTVTVTAATDKLVSGLVKLGRVSVSADAAGDVKLGDLPITINSTGNVTVAATSTSNTLYVKDEAGNAYTVTDTGLNVAAGSSGTDVITFTGDYKISAGTSKVFDIYVTAANVSGAVGTNGLTLKLTNATAFTWKDVTGGATALTAALIYGYPTNSVSISN